VWRENGGHSTEEHDTNMSFVVGVCMCYAFRNLACTDAPCMSPISRVILNGRSGLGSEQSSERPYRVRELRIIGMLQAFIARREPWYQPSWCKSYSQDEARKHAHKSIPVEEDGGHSRKVMRLQMIVWHSKALMCTSRQHCDARGQSGRMHDGAYRSLAKY
jgi:hypothetical protein